MAGSKTDAFELDVLAWITNQTRSGSAFSNTGRVSVASGDANSPYLALFTLPATSPTDASTFVEVTGGSYARVATSGLWAAPASGAVTTSGDIVFGPASADWGTIAAIGLYDKSTSGRLMYYSDLRDGGGVVVTKFIGAGDRLTIPTGQLTITEA